MAVRVPASLLFGLLLSPQPAVAQRAAEAAAATRLDAWGDPLPLGALFRTGTLRAHHDVSAPLRFSPDGKLLAAMGNDGTIRLWEAAGGKEVRRIAGRKGRISCFAFSPGGKVLVSGGVGGLHLWEAASGKEAEITFDDRDWLSDVAFSPDGARVATSGNGNVRLWDVKTAKNIWQNDESQGQRIALSDDGKLVAVGSDFVSISVWETATGKLLSRLEGTEKNERYPCFLPDGKTLLTAGEDRGVSWWEVASGRKVRHVEQACHPIAVSPDGKLLAAAEPEGEPGGIGLWDATSGKPIRRLRGHLDRVSALAFAPDGKVLTSLGDDQVLRRWNPGTGEELDRPVGHQHAVAAVAFSPDGKLLASGSADRTVRLWDPRTGREKGCLGSDHEVVKDVAFLPDGSALVSANRLISGEEEWNLPEEKRAAARVRLWDMETGRQIHHFETRQLFLRAAAFCPANGTLALGGYSSIRLLDTGTGKEHALVERADGSILNAVACSPDGKLLAGTSFLGGVNLGQYTRIGLYDATTGKERWHQDRCKWWGSVAFSPDGKTLATGGSTVCLWSTADGAERGRFEEASGCVAFSPDGRTLATSGEENGVLLWEVATGKLRRRFAGSEVSCLAFSPNGRLLATGGADTLVMVWDVTGRLQSDDAVKETPVRLWPRLADEDAAVAYEALWGLVAMPGPTVEFLRARLPVLPEPDGKRIVRWVAALDEEAFEVREKATTELRAAGLAAEPALRHGLDGKPSPEMRRRIESLLENLRQPDDPAKQPALRQTLRLVEVLEQIAGAGAKEALEELAARAASRWVRQEARASLDRLARRAQQGRSR